MPTFVKQQAYVLIYAVLQILLRI